jgi:hypothetical protein
MTQPSGELHRLPERPSSQESGAPTVSSGHPTKQDATATLGHRVWRRYGSSPGLISMEMGTSLSSRWRPFTGAGRLPLVASLFQRWMPGQSTGTTGRSGNQEFPLVWPSWPGEIATPTTAQAGGYNQTRPGIRSQSTMSELSPAPNPRREARVNRVVSPSSSVPGYNGIASTTPDSFQPGQMPGSSLSVLAQRRVESHRDVSNTPPIGHAAIPAPPVSVDESGSGGDTVAQPSLAVPSVRPTQQLEENNLGAGILARHSSFPLVNRAIVSLTHLQRGTFNSSVPDSTLLTRLVPDTRTASGPYQSEGHSAPDNSPRTNAIRTIRIASKTPVEPPSQTFSRLTAQTQGAGSRGIGGPQTASSLSATGAPGVTTRFSQNMGPVAREVTDRPTLPLVESDSSRTEASAQSGTASVIPVNRSYVGFPVLDRSMDSPGTSGVEQGRLPWPTSSLQQRSGDSSPGSGPWLQPPIYRRVRQAALESKPTGEHSAAESSAGPSSSSNGTVGPSILSRHQHFGQPEGLAQRSVAGRATTGFPYHAHPLTRVQKSPDLPLTVPPPGTGRRWTPAPTDPQEGQALSAHPVIVDELLVRTHKVVSRQVALPDATPTVSNPSRPVNTEMPLLNTAVQQQEEASTGNSLPSMSTTRGRPASGDMVLRREAPPSHTVAQQAATPGPSPAPGAPELPARSEPGAPDVDLEHLADQVYNIIERRLILERESMGL